MCAGPMPGPEEGVEVLSLLVFYAAIRKSLRKIGWFKQQILTFPRSHRKPAVVSTST